jgi:hypothetical protein
VKFCARAVWKHPNIKRYKKSKSAESDRIVLDIQAVGGRVRVDLEMNSLSLVDADVRGGTLNGPIAHAVDIPLSRRIAGPGLLANDRISHRRSTSECLA